VAENLGTTLPVDFLKVWHKNFLKDNETGATKKTSYYFVEL
jgi:hypothetical protein